MPSQKNRTELASLQEKLSSSSALYLADYSGLSVKDQVQLRQLVQTAGGTLRVTKNRLLKLAIKSRGLAADHLEQELAGPNLTLFAGTDPISPLKALVQFAKGNELGKPALKAGFLDSEPLSLDRLQSLATLPDKPTLMTQLLSLLNTPTRELAAVISAPTRQLVYALNAIKTQSSAKQA